MIKKIALSGSCYWCMEAIFQSLKGVIDVDQGWITTKHAPCTDFDEAVSYEAISYEAVVVEFDSNVIPLDVLIDIHIHTHSSTYEHALRERYPSAVYAYHQEDFVEIENILAEKKNSFEAPLLTQTRMAGQFKPSKQSMQDYYYNNPDKPFCQTIINPKLQKLMQQYGSWVEQEKLS